MGVGFVSAGRIRGKHPELGTASQPHLPPVECKVENADEYSCNGQNGCGDIGINKLIQVVKQKPALIGLDPGPGFEPVLKQSQGKGQGISSVKMPQTSEAMCSQRRMGRERVTKAPKTTHRMNMACSKRTQTASAE